MLLYLLVSHIVVLFFYFLLKSMPNVYSQRLSYMAYNVGNSTKTFA